MHHLFVHKNIIIIWRLDSFLIQLNNHRKLDLLKNFYDKQKMHANLAMSNS